MINHHGRIYKITQAPNPSHGMNSCKACRTRIPAVSFHPTSRPHITNIKHITRFSEWVGWVWDMLSQLGIPKMPNEKCLPIYKTWMVRLFVRKQRERCFFQYIWIRCIYVFLCIYIYIYNLYMVLLLLSQVMWLRTNKQYGGAANGSTLGWISLESMKKCTWHPLKSSHYVRWWFMSIKDLPRNETYPPWD